MRIPVAAINNHQLTYLLSAILILLGVVSYMTMPRAEDPLVEFPSTSITVINPGTHPEDMESLIVDVIEKQANELEDIKEIVSVIEQGMARIVVKFIYGSDGDEKYRDVQAAVSAVREQLPAGIVSIKVNKENPNEVPIVQLALSSDTGDFAQMRRVSERLETRLEQVGGVKRADIDADARMEVQILVQSAKLHALGLSLEQVQRAVSNAAENIPGGHALAGERRFSVLTSGDFDDLTQIENTIVASHPTGEGGQPIYIRNIANVRINDGLADYRSFYHNRPMVFINVLQRPGSNIFDVTTGVKSQVETFRQTLPKGLRLDVVKDQSIGVDKRVSGFFINLVQGLILVAIATFVVLGRGPSAVVVLAIPVSIFIAIGWIDLSGFALQQMSIVGLVIALGLLVDNAIVVTENVLRVYRSEESSNPQQDAKRAKSAAEKGSSQVSLAVVSGTLTTILAFVPMLLMQNDSGMFIRSMPASVLLTLLASLLVALTLTPLLNSQWLQYRARKGKAINPTPVQRALNGVAQGSYLKSLQWSLRHPKSVISIALLVFVGAFMLFPLIGVSLFPKAEKPMILVDLELPQGASFATSKARALEIEQVLRQEPLVKDVVVNVGRGNPRVYYNAVPDKQTPNYAQLLVLLHQADLAVVEPFVERLRSELNRFAGVRVMLKEFNQGPPVDAPVSIRVIGESWANIVHVSKQVEQIVRANKGTVNIDNPIAKHKIDLKLEINRDKAAMLGLDIAQIDANIRAALIGLPMGTYKDEAGDEYTILLKSNAGERPLLEAFDTLMLRTPSGMMVPLKQVAKARLTTTMPRLEHFKLERIARVKSDVRAGFNTEQVTLEILAELDKLNLPHDVRFSIGGEQANRQESFGGMVKALIVAMLGIFAVLVMQFRSFKQPLIVFSAIPFAVTGAFFALYIVGYTFSFTAFVGLTSLVGIVVNNAIILIDYANQKQLEGESRFDAITYSSQARMTPILLTTVTTIGGLLPLTLSGSAMWAPMGSAIIGGLILSTVLTLFVVPVLYLIFSDELKKGVDERYAVSKVSLNENALAR